MRSTAIKILNTLEQYLRAKKLNEVESMNDLQSAGVVSDLCVFACDVADSDCTAAIAFLMFRGIAPKPKSPVEVQHEMPFARQPYKD